MRKRLEHFAMTYEKSSGCIVVYVGEKTREIEEMLACEAGKLTNSKELLLRWGTRSERRVSCYLKMISLDSRKEMFWSHECLPLILFRS